MKATVPKEKFLQFKTVTRCHVLEVANIFTASDLQKPTRSFSLGINFPCKINNSTFVYDTEIMLCF